MNQRTRINYSAHQSAFACNNIPTVQRVATGARPLHNARPWRSIAREARSAGKHSTSMSVCLGYSSPPSA